MCVRVGWSGEENVQTLTCVFTNTQRDLAQRIADIVAAVHIKVNVSCVRRVCVGKCAFV